MKKIFFALAGVFMASALFVSCGSTNLAGNNEWWHNSLKADRIATTEFGEQAIAAVGQSTLSATTAEKAARADGRAALAQRISTVVKNRVKSKLGEENRDEAKESYDEDIDLIANQVLSGSAQVDYYFEEKTGKTFVLMGLPLAGLDKNLQSASMKTNNKVVREALNELTEEQLLEAFRQAD